MAFMINATTRLAALATLVAALASACAAPVKPAGADEVRAALLALRADARLAAEVPVALQGAEMAVQAAELPTRDLAGGQHAVHVAQRKIDIARAEAQRKLAEQSQQMLNEQRAAILADGREREVEILRAQAEAAAAAALAQQRAAAEAAAMSEELRRQMQELEATATDRGMVMTLGDVLFATGKWELQAGAAERLDKLAVFMSRYVDRRLTIEGHTDAQGSEADNLLLSERRAEAVKAYLVIQGVDSARVSTVGRGMQVPVADNATPEGRQRNRRVEIVISNP